MTPNDAEKLAWANDFITRYQGSTLTILDGEGIQLAEHTVEAFEHVTDSPGTVLATGLLEETNDNAGTASSAVLSNGSESFTMTIGFEDADINLSNRDYTDQGISRIESFRVNL